MVNTNIHTCCQTIAAPVNVLFADCQTEWVDGLTAALTDHKLTWDTVGFDMLETCLQNRTIIGAVVFGPCAADRIHPDALSFLLATLEQAGSGAFFLGDCPTSVEEHSLATAIGPEMEAELPARLDTAARFARHFQQRQSNHALEHDIAEQLEIAGQVQRNFLPSHLPHSDRARWATMFRPAQWVSGDIYDISRLDETHTGFYLADAVGHSMPAALLTIFLKQATVMRETFGNTYRIYDPDEVVAGLNRRMAQQEFAGCLFATCSYGLLNTQTLELQLARAGHPYPILIRDGQLSCLQSRGGLLGVFSEAQFEKLTVQLQPGDKLFLYSDGGEPLIGNAKDDGTFLFSKAFESIAAMPIDQMLAAYDEMAKHYRFGPGELDDVTAVGLEILP